MVESIIERITRGNFWDFHGGIHPPEQKFLTSNKPIKSLGLPKQLIIPLQQHIGLEGDLLVAVGDKVLKGQPLTLSKNAMVVPIHAPTSGIISAIKMSVIAHPSALRQLCIFLDVDGEDTWRERQGCTDTDIKQLSNQDIIAKIADAGIAGMGGAGFPTHVKVSTAPNINFLIINGAECEPYITADDLLMSEQSHAIVDGINILDKLLNPSHILVAIEDNKPNAIKAMQQATANHTKVKVCVVPTKYPTGGEKQLIQILTGKEVTAGQLPIHSGIVMQNVATCFAINDAIKYDIPLISRVVTVTGQALGEPQNVWALLGTPINFLLEQCQVNSIDNGKQPVIMGGPMMGFSIYSELVPVVKTSNCILVPSKKEMPSAFEHESKEVECIRCGQCSDVCPSQLLPQELQWSAKAKDHAQLTKLNLSDCIECGACAYVCPSQIPLVHYYRVAKAEIREKQLLDLKAEKAKVRFEARKLRLEKEKIARQEKHKKAAAARKAAMDKATPEAVGAKSAVAAALARVKAKKASQDQNITTQDSATNNATANISSESVPSESVSSQSISSKSVSDEKSQVSAAIARAKAKKKLKEQAANNLSSHGDTASESTSSSDDKKAKIAAAIAKAKAKKLTKNVSEIDANTEAEPENTHDITAKAPAAVTAPVAVAETASAVPITAGNVDKKAKIAAAIAKAKAKKLTKNVSETGANTETEPETAHDITAKAPAAVTAPVAIAETTSAVPITAGNLDKKAKIAAAIAKAKAKKKLKEANSGDNNDQNSV